MMKSTIVHSLHTALLDRFRWSGTYRISSTTAEPTLHIM